MRSSHIHWGALSDLVDAHNEVFADWRPEGNYVPGEGAVERCRVMVVGDKPSAVDRVKRRPFMGKGGRVLRQLMVTAGLSSDDTWITHLVKFKPDRHDTALSWEEVKLARPLLQSEHDAVGRPPVIVTTARNPLCAVLGTPSATAWVSPGAPVPLRSREDGSRVWLFPMLDPENALYNPAIRGAIESHWESLGEWLRANNP